MSVGDMLLTWDACEDSDIQREERGHLLERLDEIVEERNPRNVWYVEGRNLLWQGFDGFKILSAESAKDLLQKLLPQTECTFKIYAYGDHGLAVNNIVKPVAALRQKKFRASFSICLHLVCLGSLAGFRVGLRRFCL